MEGMQSNINSPNNKFVFVPDVFCDEKRKSAYHPVPRFIYWGVKEIVLIVSSRVFLGILCNQVASKSAELSEYCFRAIVRAPMGEEIFFRGILLTGLEGVQKLGNWIWVWSGKIVTQEDLKAQKVYRIHTAAFIFAAAHLTNHAYILSSGALIQFTFAYIGGYSYGHLKEKYNTLSIGIVAHGIHNSICMIGVIYMNTVNGQAIATLCVYTVMFLDYVWYRIGREEVPVRDIDRPLTKIEMDYHLNEVFA